MTSIVIIVSPCVVRGHHIYMYKTTWTPVLDQMLQVHTEAGSSHDARAVATSLDGGCWPRDVSE